MTECRERCERALLGLAPHATANMRPRMQMQIALTGAIYISFGSAEQARTVLADALETADALNDSDAQAWVLTSPRPREAQRYYERVLRSPVKPGDRHGVIFYKANDQASARAMLAQALWFQRFAEKALSECHASLEEPHCAPTAFALPDLVSGICRIAPMVGDFEAAERANQRLIEVATSLNAHYLKTARRFVQGK